MAEWFRGIGIEQNHWTQRGIIRTITKGQRENVIAAGKKSAKQPTKIVLLTVLVSVATTSVVGLEKNLRENGKI